MSVAAHRFSNDLRYRDGDHPDQTQITPDYVLDLVRLDLGGIGLDPCTTPDNPVGAERFYTPSDDGLKANWFGPGWWPYCTAPDVVYDCGCGTNRHCRTCLWGSGGTCICSTRATSSPPNPSGRVAPGAGETQA